MENLAQPETGARRRIFLSYKHSSNTREIPDEALATRLYSQLSAAHHVFIDKDITPGENWAERIDAELRGADYLIPLLSAESVSSEMVLGEIEKAHRLGKEQNGRPLIIPVRIAYSDSYPYPLDCYLNHIQWVYWGSEEDTDRLTRQIADVVVGRKVNGGVPSQPPQSATAKSRKMAKPLPVSPLELPGGAMNEQSRLYVERPSDTVARAAIARNGVTVTIRGSRQMGKSSLLIRTIDVARKARKTVALLDFQLLDRTSFSSAEVFMQRFCSWITATLEVEDAVAKFWNVNLPIGICCTEYFSRYLIPKIGKSLVLAIDEADRISECDFSSDFYGMLRAWHNKRAEAALWKNLDLVLVVSTEPYNLIRYPNQSPFNIGEVIELDEFTAENVADLNERHGQPLDMRDQARLLKLVGGQPYLLRRALYLVVEGFLTPAELFRHARDDRGPFGDHLRYHMMQLQSHADLAHGMSRVLSQTVVPDDAVLTRLQGAGLVSKRGTKVVPRCKLYADYFGPRLHA